MKLTNLILCATALLIAGCNSSDTGKSGQTVGSLPIQQRAGDTYSVTHDLGPLYVVESPKNDPFYAEAARRPWVSWWYPASRTTMFQPNGTRAAPLQKLDSWSRKIYGSSPSAVDFEIDNRANAYEDWEGLCHGWARASIMEANEPSSARTVDGVTYEVGDLKAILLKTYENLKGEKFYGQRYTHPRTDDINDIYPDQFHRFLQSELFTKHKAFIMDIDPDQPVWNFPAWAAQLEIVKDTKDSRVLHVTAYVRYTSPFVKDANIDYAGFGDPSLTPFHPYTYDLYGQPQGDGSWKVDGGVWTGSSLDDHPDYVVSEPEHGDHWSSNPNIDTAKVKELLNRAGFPLTN